VITREIDEPEIRLRVMAIVDRQVREALEVMANHDPALHRIVRKRNTMAELDIAINPVGRRGVGM
jgi:hypothetical protein